MDISETQDESLLIARDEKEENIKTKRLLYKRLKFILIMLLILIGGVCCILTFIFLMWARQPFAQCSGIPSMHLDANMSQAIINFPDEAFGKLSINHLQFLGTHNSFHVEPSISFKDSFRYTHEPLLSQANRGVRHFELDSHYSYSTERWIPYHIALIDDKTNCGPCLSNCISQLKQWSDDNNNHTIIIVYLEPKTIFNARPFCRDGDDVHLFNKMESEVLSHISLHQIVVPQQIRGSFDTLNEAVLKRGWPSVESTRGKFLFVLNLWSENMHCRKLYINKKHPLFFMRIDDGGPDTAFVEMGSRGNKDSILESLKKNYFVRTAADSVESVNYGAQLLSTDFYHDYLPKTTVCNSVTAPKDCRVLNP
ncbi:phosphoinositide-specific phospholipase C [Acrasis kona]|uniref:Phosphoinositide-specific phospholipase C n=1 Tax=Acrasis kona TaxID=1008807 RepID=A0AAW2ZF75_9EUKA